MLILKISVKALIYNNRNLVNIYIIGFWKEIAFNKDDN